MKRKFLFGCLVAAFSLIAGARHVLAHDVVSPNTATPSQFVNFTLGVPTEKNIPTIAVRLLLPAGLNEVSPIVKPGWKISVQKSGDTITEIDWSGNTIPVGQKDLFLFSAQVPAQPGELDWKAYQTYQDGSVVAWDQPPSSGNGAAGMNMDNMANGGPYSITKIASASVQPAPQTPPSAQKPANNTTVNLALVISIVALVFSLRGVLVKKN